MQLVASATEASGLESPSPAVIYVGPKGPTSYNATTVRLYHLRAPMFCGYALAAPGAMGIALLFRDSHVLKSCSDGFSDLAKARLRAPQKYSSKSRLN